MATPKSSPPTKRVRVWDLPTRIFHWSLVLCVLGLIVSGKMGGNAMVWHGRLGYAVFALLLFRFIWGLVGGHWSRFVQFIYSPRSIWAYLKGQAPARHLVGHNPLGSLSVFALLAMLAAQVGTGLISDDEIAFTGPLIQWVSSDTALTATSYHRSLGQALLFLLVFLHLAAIVFYRLKKKEKLLQTMLTGDKEWRPSESFEATPVSSQDSSKTRWLALTVFVLCCAGVGVLVTWL